MELCCDGERVFVARDCRVEGIAKRDLLERGAVAVTWQSEKLPETPGRLVNTRRYLIGVAGSLVIRMDRRSGESVVIDVGNEVKDVTADLREVFLTTPEGIYRVPAERFTEAELFRLPVSDILSRPLVSLQLLGDSLFVAGGSFLYRLTRRGEKLAEKALAGCLKLLVHREGAVAVTEEEVVYLTEDLEVLSSGRYGGVFRKAEHALYSTFLLTDRELSVFGLTGERFAHVEGAHYGSFTEGLNHLYLYDEMEGSLTVTGKKELLGDSYQEVDLTTLVGLVMGSLLLAERGGAEVMVREEKDFIDVHINGEHVPLERVILSLTRFFPELFFLYRNPGYYDEIESFALKFDLFRVEGKEVRLNTDLLDRLLAMHSAFRTFEEDIVRELMELPLRGS